MPIPENFKYDMRVRERMLKRGILTEGELTKHIDGLSDVTDLVVEVELKQPALMRESERETRVVTRASIRPPAALPVRSLENEINDIDDDEDDDLDDLDDEDEDDLKAKADKPAAEAKPVEAAPAEVAAVEPAPAAADEDLDK